MAGYSEVAPAIYSICVISNTLSEICTESNNVHMLHSSAQTHAYRHTRIIDYQSQLFY